MHYTYILRSEIKGILYTGSTTDLRRRLISHNRGENFATRPYRPWKLIFYAAFQSQELSESFEKYLKFGSGKAFAYKRLIGQKEKHVSLQ